MSPKLSLIITIAVGVVAFGAPAASGQDRLGEWLAHRPNVSADIRGQTEGVRLARSDRGDPLAASLEFAARSAGTASVAPTSSGSGIEWPQLGAGFGLGILLALGVVLGLRHARVRPLPQ